MKYLALVLAALVGFASEARADMPTPLIEQAITPTQTIPVDQKTKWVIYGSHDQYLLERISATQFTPPCDVPTQHGCWPVAPTGKRYAMEVAPDGYGQPYMVADLIGQGTAPLRYDNSGNLYVTVGGTGAVVAPLPGGSSTAVANNQSIGIQAADQALANMVPLTETSNALDINLKSQNAGLTLNTKVSASASGGYSKLQLDFSSATTAQNVKTGAGTVYKFQWVCNSAMTSTTIVTLYDGVNTSGTPLGSYTFLAGGYDVWELPGGSFSTGLEVGINATTTQSGCKFMAYYQ